MSSARDGNVAVRDGLVLRVALSRTYESKIEQALGMRLRIRQNHAYSREASADDECGQPFLVDAMAGAHHRLQFLGACILQLVDVDDGARALFRGTSD